MTERYTLEEVGLNFIVNDNGRNLTAKQTVIRLNAHYEDTQRLKNDVSKLRKENEQLKQSNERIVKDIDLALGFIRHKGYSLQDIKDYEDAKKEYEEDLAYYRKGDVE